MSLTTPDISVIICAYTEKRWDDLVAAAESIQQQRTPPREIIVVIDHNSSLLSRVQENLAGVIAIENHEPKGLSGARNSGAKVAQGAVVAFLDDDAIARPDWIENLAACYISSSIVGVCGKIEPLWSEVQPSWFPSEFNWIIGCTYEGMPTKDASIRNMIGANMSVRRDILISMGGFRTSFGCNKDTSIRNTRFRLFQHYAGDEETEFCIRVSRQVPDSLWFYTTSAIVQHRVSVQRAHLAYFIWRCYDEGLGKASLVRLHNAQLGLSSEKAYAFKVLPRGVVRGLTDALLHRELSGLARSGAIIAGLWATIAGYLVGRISSQIVALRNTGSTARHHQHTWEILPPIEVQQQGKEDGLRKILDHV